MFYEEIVKVYLNTNDINVNEILDCFSISNERAEEEKLIYEIIK